MNKRRHSAAISGWFLSIPLLFSGSCKPESGHNQTTEPAPRSSIRLVEYELLAAVKDCPNVSKEKPVLAVRVAITCPSNKDSHFILPFAGIILSAANNRRFPLNYLGAFDEKIDEFGLPRLDTLREPKEITHSKRFNDEPEECSSFIFFPPSEGKTAFLLFDKKMCASSIQIIHMGFDVAEHSGPFRLRLPNSNTIEIPQFSSKTVDVIRRLSNEEIKSIGQAYSNLEHLSGQLWQLIGKPSTVAGLTTYEGTDLSGTYSKFLAHGILIDTAGEFTPANIVTEYKEEMRKLDSAGVLILQQEIARQKTELKTIIAVIESRNNVAIDRPDEIAVFYAMQPDK